MVNVAVGQCGRFIPVWLPERNQNHDRSESEVVFIPEKVVFLPEKVVFLPFCRANQKWYNTTYFSPRANQNWYINTSILFTATCPNQKWYRLAV